MFYTVEASTMLKKGEDVKSERFTYTFNDPSKSIIENRFNAIQKCKDLLDFFNNEVGEDFDSPLEAALKGYKSFGAYSIRLVFHPEDGCEEYSIWGDWDTEENLDWMEGEYNSYLKDHIDGVEVEGYTIANQEIDFFIYN